MKHSIKPLDWDSDFFNLKVGKAQKTFTAQEFNEVKTEFDLVYFFLDEFSKGSDVWLNEIGCQHVDTKYVYETEVQKVSKPNSIRLFDLKHDPIETLYDLAFASGQYSRYKLDKNFKAGSFTSFYKTWINNSINHSIADKVFVSHEEGFINGFITLSFKNRDKAVIGLIAVDQKYRGKGIGKKLIEQTHYFLKRNTMTTKIEVATQENNKGACSFYEKLNFKVVDKKYIYHWWKKNDYGSV